MKKHLLVALSVLCLCSCFEEKKIENDKEDIVAKQETKSTPDKYVYIDDYRCLHLNKDCIAFLTERDHLDMPLYSIRYYARKDLEISFFSSYCRQCTEIEDYEEIKEILRINSNRRKIYDICELTYDMGTYDDFKSDINNPIKRKNLYDALKEDGYTGIGDTYAEFVDLISPKGKREDDYWEQYRVVYVCSNKLTIFHYDKNCIRLKECNGWLDEITIGEAEKQNIKSCEYCKNK